MEGLFFFLLLLTVLFVIFLVRVWRFMARHPLVKLLDDVAFKIDVIEENELGEPSEARTVHIRLTRTQ
jgi:hypothetical protein